MATSGGSGGLGLVTVAVQCDCGGYTRGGVTVHARGCSGWEPHAPRVAAPTDVVPLRPEYTAGTACGPLDVVCRDCGAGPNGCGQRWPGGGACPGRSNG